MLRIVKKSINLFRRKILYRKYKIGKNFHAGLRVRLWAKKTIIIGNNFYIGRDSFIESDVLIGNDVIWGNRVALVGRYDHNYQQVGIPIRLAMSIREKKYDWKGINELTEIENDVWVGYGATILSGVKIHEGSIIAACSLVTKDVEPYSIYAGVPAKKISSRFKNSQQLRDHLELVNSKYKNILH